MLFYAIRNAPVKDIIARLFIYILFPLFIGKNTTENVINFFVHVCM